MKANQLSKFMKKLMADKKFMKKLYEKSANYELAYDFLASAMEYYAVTDGKCKITEPKMLFEYLSECTIPHDKLLANTKNNFFMTHSFNGANRKCVKKFGLGDKKTFNPAISTALNELEAVFGKSQFHQFQQNTSNEIYMTAMGVKSFHYACTFSPERLFLGILKQEQNNALPIILGETKQDYFLRVLNKKLEGIAVENKDEILKQGKMVISYFCEKKPNIAFFSPASKKYELNVAHANSNIGNFAPITDFIDEATRYNPLNFYTTNTNGAETNNLGNLVSTNTIIPTSEIGLLEVEDRFEIMTQIAYAHGLTKGQTIDYFTGKPIAAMQRKAKKATADKSAVTEDPTASIQEKTETTIDNSAETAVELCEEDLISEI